MSDEFQVYNGLENEFKKHLDRYVDEFEFRSNFKHISDVQRFGQMLQVCDGRLTYKNLLAK
jgi:hypothetical protein